MTLAKRLLIAAGAVLVATLVLLSLVFANLTRVLRTVLEKEVPGLTFKEVDVGWNSVSITEVEVKRSGKSVFRVESLRAYPSLLSVFTDTLRIASIEIDAPYVFLVRNPDGSLVLPTPESLDGTKQKPKTTETPAETTASQAILIDTLKIRRGKGDLLDRSVSGPPAKFTLTELELRADTLAVPSRDERLHFEVSMKLEGKRIGTMHAKGWYEQSSRAADVEFKLAELFLPQAEPYYRGKHTSAAISDGVLAVASTIVMKDGKYVASNVVQLSGLAFTKGGFFLGIPVGILREHLEKGGKPMVVELELEGSLDDKSKLQQKLVSEVVKVLAKELGSKALSHVADEFKKSVSGEGESAIKSFFGK